MIRIAVCTAILSAGLAVIYPVQNAHAVSCITANEFQNVEDGMRKNYVQEVIFDGYDGSVYWTSETDNWSYTSKAYDRCNGDGQFLIQYRLNLSDPNGYRVYDKLVA